MIKRITSNITSQTRVKREAYASRASAEIVKTSHPAIDKTKIMKKIKVFLPTHFVTQGQ